MKKQYVRRVLNMTGSLARKSQFLFGPRQTGKTMWMDNELTTAAFRFNLLESNTYQRLAVDPSYLRQVLRRDSSEQGLVIIDEIQKLPSLLGEVHNLIETTGFRFLLTGSSARKLRAQEVNLLGGRAGWKEMYPFVYPEIRDMGYSLDRIFSSGLVPSCYLSAAPDEELSDYIGLYLSQEIQQEGLVRNLPAFSRFLEVAALANAEMINCANISKEVGISATGISEWFRILYDTLVGFEVPAFQKTKKRKTYATSKFYFFDVGIVRRILGLERIQENTVEFGKFFESYIAHELRAFLGYVLGYHDKDGRLCYWRTLSNQEVDFIVDGKLAIETKTTRRYSNSDLKGLRALKEEGICQRHILVCREEQPLMSDDGIEILPYKTFLEELWSRRFL